MERSKQLEVLQKNTWLTTLTNQKKANSFIELFEKKQTSFALVKKEKGESAAKVLIASEVGNMIEILDLELSERQIDYLIEYILKNYWSYSLSDLGLLTEHLSGQKTFGKPKLQNVILGLSEYSSERDEFAVNVRIKESGELKTQPIENDKIVKIYKNMKTDLKKPKLTQGEKDTENKNKFELKLRQLKALYPSKENKK